MARRSLTAPPMTSRPARGPVGAPGARVLRPFSHRFQPTRQGERPMPGPRPLIGRRHLLASTLAGSVGMLLPAAGARAAAAPPSPGGPETIAPTPAAAPNPVAAGAFAMAAAVAPSSGDASI